VQPNVCVVVLDALRADHVGAYGHERATTPTIDRVAKEGHQFDTAIAPTGVTLDSVTSMFSGRYPGEHQSGRAGRMNVDDEVPLLPELLQQVGYTTCMATANPFLTPWFGFGAGVDEFAVSTHAFDDGMNMQKFFTETKHLSRPRRYARFFRQAVGQNFFATLGNALQFRFDLFEGDDDGAERITTAVEEFVGRREEPWFCYAHYSETHMNSVDEWPYSVPSRDKFRYVDERPDPDRLATRGGTVDYDAATMDAHARLYDGAVRYLDRHVERIVDRLKTTDQWDETVLLVTSDHGEMLGERGLLGHGYLYEPGVRVPLVVSTPDGVAVEDGATERRVNTLGLRRSVARLAGVDPGGGHGVDFFANEPTSDVLFQDYSNTWDWSRYGGEDQGRHCLYRDGWKLHAVPEGNELYNVDSDPDETTDLSTEAEDVHGELQTALDDLLSDLDLSDQRAATTIDDRAADRLAELGYLD
jgi:arylsulfatase A-like enzyme